MKKNVLELKNVWKVYQMDSVKVPALKGVSLTVNKGEFLSVIGASGSGKSTLLNIIGALDLPTKGDVFLDGIDITKLQESELARIRGKKIGFVFQTFNLYPTLNVFENIALPMRIHESSDQEIKKSVLDLVKLVGLEHRVYHLPAQLSGGERQRVAIARALSTDPEMVLADEPTGNLDTVASQGIIRLLIELNKKHGKTVVLVTHDSALSKLADRIVTIKDGMIVSS